MFHEIRGDQQVAPSSSVSRQLALAQSAAVGGRWHEARLICREVLRLQPDNSVALVQLSYVESMAGSARLSREYALTACDSGSKSPAVLADILSRLRTFNEVRRIRRLVAGMGALDSVPIPLLLVIATQLSYLGQQSEALVYLEEALRGDPNYPPSLLGRAQLYIYLGRFAEAMQDLQACRVVAPNLPRLYWLWSRLRKAREGDNNVSQLRRLIDIQKCSRDGLAELAFALHKELHDLGDAAGAWAALDFGCKVKRATLNYDSAVSNALFGDIVRWDTSTQQYNRYEGIEQSGVPVFIVGMHRSGTSLLEHLLAAVPGVDAFGELYDFTICMRQAADYHCRGVIDRELVARCGDVDFAQVGRAYFEGINWRRSGGIAFTDKLPSNFLNIGFIVRALPQARILHMVRDPRDTCFSSLRELYSDANPFSYDQAELASYYRNYESLMRHWRLRYGGQIMDVDYRRLTDDPDGVIREVAQFCSATGEISRLEPPARAVATASAIQVREGVQRRGQPLWLPYQEQLSALLNGLADS